MASPGCLPPILLFVAAFLLPSLFTLASSARVVPELVDESHTIGFRGELIPLEGPGDATNRVHKFGAAAVRSNSRSISVSQHIESKRRPSDFVSPVMPTGGGYLMSLTIGSPPKTLRVIADTGSDLIWVKCQPCASGCFEQPDAMFSPLNSTTYKTLSCSNPHCKGLSTDNCTHSSGAALCHYNFGYGGGSFTNGTLSLETVTLTNTSGSSQAVPHLVFGCGYANSDSFNAVEGLAGLGKGPLSFTSQLGSTYGNKFSYCMNNIFEQTPTSPKNAPIFFGDVAVPKASVKYTPFVPNDIIPTFYYVNLLNISVQNKMVENIPQTAFSIDSSGNGGMVFDSGSTITQLFIDAYNPLEQALKDEITSLNTVDSPFPSIHLCYDTSKSRNPKFPSITFHFQGADFEIPPKNVFVPADKSGNTTCLAICPGSTNSPVSIFGNIQQADHHILYDLKNSQLGFTAVTDCSSL